MHRAIPAALLLCALALESCRTMSPGRDPQTFGEEVRFLEHHTEVIVLGDDPRGPRVALVPAWQGRVAVSTATGDDGRPFGWLNRELIRSGELRPHINAFGGEDRFWLGPEGGQYSLFFPPGADFDLASWQTPAAIDSEPYVLLERSARRAVFIHEATLTNRAGTRFDVGIRRTVRLLDASGVLAALGRHPGSRVGVVAFETANELTNRGAAAWTEESGLVSIWILGMFRAGPGATAVIPFRPGPESELGPIVNDAYFGPIAPERLVVGERALFFRADARSRGKLGLSAARATPFAGSYDPGRALLTIVQYDLPEPRGRYVASTWELQAEPYAGDVVNSYNDGPPPGGGEQLGAFYELESSSPALALSPGESAVHRHRTFHFVGPADALDPLARQLLGVSIAEIERAFP